MCWLKLWHEILKNAKFHVLSLRARRRGFALRNQVEGLFDVAIQREISLRKVKFLPREQSVSSILFTLITTCVNVSMHDTRHHLL